MATQKKYIKETDGRRDKNVEKMTFSETDHYMLEILENQATGLEAVYDHDGPEYGSNTHILVHKLFHISISMYNTDCVLIACRS